MKISKTQIVFTVAGMVLLLRSSAIAIPDQEVRWEGFVGNIRTGAAGAVGSGTGAVNAAGGTWVTTGGEARVKLASGEIRFNIEGLVRADGNDVGTPGSNTQVRGTLVCDTNGSAGAGNSTLVPTPLVPLSPQGDAEFKGNVGPLPAACINEPDIAFLVRSTSGSWFAAAIVRTP
ncbi:MAG: hypothetical protein HY695_06000 [Deltaproteobacteria bacterium]|nr:hypothetical protein [Deltaproteobacteria bacterium]